MRIDLLDQNLFGGCAHDLFDDLAILEKEKGGYVVDAVLLGELLLFVDVDFDDFDLVGELLGNFVEQGGDRFAGTTPFGPKIDNSQFIGLDHFALEIESANRGNIRTHCP
jgi:hypothetical protein